MIKRLAIILRIGLSLALMGLAVGLSLAALSNLTPVRAAEAAAPVTGLRIIQSDEDRLILELAAPEYVLQAATTAPAGFQQILVDEASVLAVPGQPELPKFSALIGIPAQGDVSVQVLQDDLQPLPDRYQLLPSASPVPLTVSAKLTGDLQPGTTQRVPDRAAYASAELYPGETARVVGTAWLRDQRLAQIELYPFQYRASTGTLVWHRYLRVEVRFAGGRTTDRVASAPRQNDPFEQILQRDVLNYEVARRWRSQATAPSTTSRAETVAPRYKIVVDQDGLYRVTYNDLVSAGLVMTSFDPRNLQLTNQGLTVAVEIVGEADGGFDPDDYLLFYGQRLRGDLLASRHAAEADNWLTLNGWQPQFNATMVEKYTDDNVYWLEVGTT
ncbi:MAG TPA: C25 family peptidase propeptide domain-containing protein, partial [Anaerolineae bacterium]|nr:C25 family peptidase propeptide domain-containing protein [Anaerolineae bacterium]